MGVNFLQPNQKPTQAKSNPTQPHLNARSLGQVRSGIGV